jgi:hypothetical protein
MTKVMNVLRHRGDPVHVRAGVQQPLGQRLGGGEVNTISGHINEGE